MLSTFIYCRNSFIFSRCFTWMRVTVGYIARYVSMCLHIRGCCCLGWISCSCINTSNIPLCTRRPAMLCCSDGPSAHHSSEDKICTMFKFVFAFIYQRWHFHCLQQHINIPNTGNLQAIDFSD